MRLQVPGLPGVCRRPACAPVCIHPHALRVEVSYNPGMPDVYVSGNRGETPPSPNPVPVSRTEEITAGGDRERQEREKVQAGQLVADILRRVGEVPRKALGGAYNVCPGGRFINEQEDEQVVLLLRAHPVTNLKWIVVVVLILLVTEILLGAGILGNVPGRFVVVVRLTVYLLALGYAFQRFLDWYYSVLIITNERIVNFDWINLLYRMVTYATLNHIEEPSIIAGGFTRSFFKYGDLVVETAAETPSIEVSAIPYPDKVIRILSELSESLEERRSYGQ
jgi:hypothetical protein